MRVDAVAPSSAVSAAAESPRARASQEVPLTRTVTSREEMRAALGRAYEQRLGEPATPAALDLLSAQASLETGRGRSMYNFNFGGIKGTSPEGLTTVARTHEWSGATRYETHAHFRAYGSLDEGAQDFLSLLHRRYGDAVEAAGRGDVAGYAHALKQGGYFTGPEDRYANDLRGLLGQERLPESAPGPSALSSAGPLAPAPTPFSSSTEVALMLDAVSMSAARIAEPDAERT